MIIKALFLLFFIFSNCIYCIHANNGKTNIEYYRYWVESIHGEEIKNNFPIARNVISNLADFKRGDILYTENKPIFSISLDDIDDVYFEYRQDQYEHSSISLVVKLKKPIHKKFEKFTQKHLGEYLVETFDGNIISSIKLMEIISAGKIYSAFYEHEKTKFEKIAKIMGFNEPRTVVVSNKKHQEEMKREDIKRERKRWLKNIELEGLEGPVYYTTEDAEVYNLPDENKGIVGKRPKGFPFIMQHLDKIDKKPYIKPLEENGFVGMSLGEHRIIWFKKDQIALTYVKYSTTAIKSSYLDVTLRIEYVENNEGIGEKKYKIAAYSYILELLRKELITRIGNVEFKKWKEKEVDPLIKEKSVDELLDILFKEETEKINE